MFTSSLNDPTVSDLIPLCVERLISHAVGIFSKVSDLPLDRLKHPWVLSAQRLNHTLDKLQILRKHLGQWRFHRGYPPRAFVPTKESLQRCAQRLNHTLDKLQILRKNIKLKNYQWWGSGDFHVRGYPPSKPLRWNPSRSESLQRCAPLHPQ